MVKAVPEPLPQALPPPQERGTAAVEAIVRRISWFWPAAWTVLSGMIIAVVWSLFYLEFAAVVTLAWGVGWATGAACVAWSCYGEEQPKGDAPR